MNTWVVMASGPSMCQEDADAVRDWRNGKDRRAIAINNTGFLAPWADIMYACDLRWWKRYHAEVVKQCTGEYWCHNKFAEKEFGLNRYDPRHTGGNGGYMCIRLAIEKFAAERVILLGFDMQGGHWHGQHKDFPNPTGHNFKIWIGWLQRLAVEFSGVEIINASRETALDCFPRLDLKSALC